MQTKLTLTIEKEVILSAKLFAQKTGKSLSEIIENYLSQLVTSSQKKIDKEEISPKIRKLIGCAKGPKNFDYKKILTEELSKKYNL